MIKKNGPLSMSEIRAELNGGGTLSLGSKEVRELGEIPDGPISFSDLYGKEKVKWLLAEDEKIYGYTLLFSVFINGHKYRIEVRLGKEIVFVIKNFELSKGTTKIYFEILKEKSFLIKNEKGLGAKAIFSGGEIDPLLKEISFKKTFYFKLE